MTKPTLSDRDWRKRVVLARYGFTAAEIDPVTGD
jgi:hypothetical protein